MAWFIKGLSVQWREDGDEHHDTLMRAGWLHCQPDEFVADYIAAGGASHPEATMSALKSRSGVVLDLDRFPKTAVMPKWFLVPTGLRCVHSLEQWMALGNGVMAVALLEDQAYDALMGAGVDRPRVQAMIIGGRVKQQNIDFPNLRFDWDNAVGPVWLPWAPPVVLGDELEPAGAGEKARHQSALDFLSSLAGLKDGAIPMVREEDGKAAVAADVFEQTWMESVGYKACSVDEWREAWREFGLVEREQEQY